jgi:hypothetical protein
VLRSLQSAEQQQRQQQQQTFGNGSSQEDESEEEVDMDEDGSELDESVGLLQEGAWGSRRGSAPNAVRAGNKAEDAAFHARWIQQAGRDGLIGALVAFGA